MAHCQQAPDHLIDHYSYRPDWLLNGMITLEKEARQSTVQRASSSSNLGRLDVLPLEVMHLLLRVLDLRSISRLSQACIRGQAVVQSFPIYQDLLRHAPHAVAALGQTALLRHHSATALYTSLCSQSCVSCTQFGAFLFLPTCERCCYECLVRNQALWIIPRALAKKCFGLNDSQIKEVPVMHCLPGFYEVEFRKATSRKKRLNLVSVKAAKAVAIRVHGSTANMPDWSALSCDDSLSTRDWRAYNDLCWLQKAPMRSLDGDPVMLPVASRTSPDNYCGMASIPMPVLLPDGQHDAGFWCRGCELAGERLMYEAEQETHFALGFSIPMECEKERVLIGLRNRARSRQEFVRHAQTCYGVQRLPLRT